MDSDDEEEEKSNIAALREQLAALKLWLNNMMSGWRSSRSTGWI